MVVHQGEEDEVTTASTASATSEATTRAIDISATASPSGTPSDSLDRDVDPKEMMQSSDDVESNIELPAVTKENTINNSNEDSNPEDVIQTNSSDSSTRRPPPSYSELKQEARLVEKVDNNEKVSVKKHRRNQSSCGGNKIIVDVNSPLVDTNKRQEINISGSTEKAVCFDSAYKHYGKGKKQHPVLLGLDLNAEKGKIYGLLGPSGCGKTTLLKCIVGKLKLNSGSIRVFGEQPGTKGCGVPGSRVGYMPQELALFGEFNIAETLRYFSRIYGMTYDKYKERITFLMKFLDLPSQTRQLHAMSGGQQRRASLAVALLHEPELLILDEPTVGVDPLLRTSIWNHMTDLCSPVKPNSGEKESSSGLGGTSIVITTHYIEEARQAHRVGMMRFGKLLEEGHPDDLMARYQKPNLEDVFLELCIRDGDLETMQNRKERSKRPKIFNKKKKNNTSTERESSPHATKLAALENHSTQYNNCHKTEPLLSSSLDDSALSQVVIVPSSPSSYTTSKNEAGLTNNSRKRHSRMPSSLSATNQVNNNNNKKGIQSNSKKSSSEKTYFNMNPGRVNACMIKTFNRMKKRIGFLIYQFVLPAIQVSLFCLAIGQDPKDLSVGIVNGENPGMLGCPNDFVSGSNFSYPCPIDKPSSWEDVLINGNDGGLNEHGKNFVCRYLSFLDRDVVSPVYYPNVEEATKAVENGDAWGVISVGGNFSEKLYERIVNRPDFADDSWELEIDKSVYEQSSIKVKMDITNQHIAFTLQVKFVEAFEKFGKQLVESCNLPEELVEIPLVFEEPVYGSKELTFTDFMAPGIILTIVHSMALGYSAMIIIIERNEGLLDRTWVAGVTPAEFSLAHFLVSLVVNLLQVVVTLVFMISVFQVPAEGSIVWIFLLTMLQGIAGTSIGLIISAVCETQQDATQIALGIFYPNLILSGIIWPLESMPVVLRYFAYILPQTFACEAMRGILLRGWGITFMPVWRGFLVSIAWIVGCYTIFKRLMIKES